VLELEVVGQVPERPDPRGAGGVGIVGADMTMDVDVDPRRGDTEPVAVRYAPGRH
jgi:hypothetical protein